MRIIFCFIIISIMVFFNSCKKEQPTESLQQTGVIIPLHVGNTWYNKITVYDSLGSTIRSYIDSVKIYKDTIIESEKWYFYLYNYFDYQFTANFNRSDGYYSHYESKEPPEIQETIMWKYPTKVGDIYSDFNIEVKSVSDEISVEAGKFTCIQYYWNYTGSSKGHEQNWICPNVGEIKSLSYIRNGSGKLYLQSSCELINYKLYNY